MAKWCDVSTKLGTGKIVNRIARRATRITSGAGLDGILMRPGSTVDLRATLVTESAVYLSVLRTERNIGGVTHRTTAQANLLSGNTAPLLARWRRRR